MNYLEEKVLNLLKEKSFTHQTTNQETYIEIYWTYFNEINTKLNPKKPLPITKQEFKLLLSEIYSTLILRISEEQLNSILLHYVTLLAADHCDTQFQINVNLEHCLDKLFYLATYQDKKITQKFYKDIPTLKNKIYKKFNIPETIPSKIKRKIRCNYLKDVGNLN